jgi:hypothetical protein
MSKNTIGEVSRNQDNTPTPPKWFKPLLDWSNRDPVASAKTLIETSFPAVTNIQLFHEISSDMWWDMKTRFLYKGRTIEFPITYQDATDTLTNNENWTLSPHIQKMTPFERGIFNVLVRSIKNLENWRPVIHKKTHASLEGLSDLIQTA